MDTLHIYIYCIFIYVFIHLFIYLWANCKDLPATEPWNHG